MAQALPPLPDVRQPYSDPSHHGADHIPAQPRKIRFLHPGYSDEEDILLQFDAYDGSGGGVHYRTAHTACAMIANNQSNGFFSTDADGQAPIAPSDSDAHLLEEAYYFHVPGDRKYAIVPTFADWRFPHNGLSRQWQESPGLPDLPIQTSANRNGCCMTRSTLAVEEAHIIPTNERDRSWFDDNGMSRYGDMNSASNTLYFRVDVHQVFDRKPQFAVVPKAGSWVAHVFHAPLGSEEAAKLYHNVPLQNLKSVRKEFLLARMAWTVFLLLELFLSAGKSRRLVRIGTDGQQMEPEDIGGAKCRDIIRQSRSRSVSPRKRTFLQRNEIRATAGCPHDEDIVTDDDDDYRGRKKRRSASPDSPSFGSISTPESLSDPGISCLFTKTPDTTTVDSAA
ncbi:hypothetical protein LTR41_011390 [Exophiala xenobiotica]|nr:hypothetical protein LTR41_011390 [Exophiala xenobiotica]KAK5550507.1 hypothetical protein LTR46_011487 [Exophiala xenobiotica]